MCERSYTWTVTTNYPRASFASGRYLTLNRVSVEGNWKAKSRRGGWPRTSWKIAGRLRLGTWPAGGARVFALLLRYNLTSVMGKPSGMDIIQSGRRRSILRLGRDSILQELLYARVRSFDRYRQATCTLWRKCHNGKQLSQLLRRMFALLCQTVRFSRINLEKKTFVKRFEKFTRA